MRIVFMGTPQIAAEVLKVLYTSGHEIAAVITQPDKPKGRGKELGCSPVKEFALQNELIIYQPLQVKEAGFLEILRALTPEIIVVAAFGQLLSKEIIELPKFGCLNVHASLLPKYRGAAPIQWCIIDGMDLTGITIMQMDVGLDTGDMLLKTEVPILPEETAGSLHDKLAVAAGPVLLEALKQIKEGNHSAEKQEDSLSNYASILTKGDGNIDFTKDAVQIERLIRGLSPWPSAFTHLNGKTLKIWKASVSSEQKWEQEYLKEAPGTVCRASKELIIKTGKGFLEIKELQLEGKRKVTIEEFLRGYSLQIGVVLPC